MNATQKKLRRLVQSLRPLTDPEIADYIGVNKSTLSRWLAGISDPDKMMASVRKIDAAYLRAGV